MRSLKVTFRVDAPAHTGREVIAKVAPHALQTVLRHDPCGHELLGIADSGKLQDMR